MPAGDGRPSHHRVAIESYPLLVRMTIGEMIQTAERTLRDKLILLSVVEQVEPIIKHLAAKFDAELPGTPNALTELHRAIAQALAVVQIQEKSAPMPF